MKELVTYLATNLVGDRANVRVKSGKDKDSISLSVAKSDRGAIIGKEGRTIKSLRALVRAAGTKSGTRPQLILED